MAVGLLSGGNALHLTPVSSVVSVRPSHSYTNTVDRQSDIDAFCQAPANARHHGPVEVQKGESVDMKYYPEGSRESTMQLHRLLSCKGDAINFDQPAVQYVNQLFPEPPSAPSATAPAQTHSSGALSLELIRRLPPRDLVGHLLKKKPIMQYSMICRAAGRVKESELLKHLSDLARLVNGVWVQRSRDAVEESLVPFRDYLLLLLATSTYVSRRSFTDQTGLPPHLVRSLFSPLLKKVTGKGWALQTPPDAAFLASHPAKVEEERVRWRDESDAIASAVNESRVTMTLLDRQRSGIITPTLTPIARLRDKRARTRLCRQAGISERPARDNSVVAQALAKLTQGMALAPGSPLSQ
ncbi:DNA-directed RNA polymerase III subunit Rpc5 [Kipferlia bialata]|uniref:DNA-directed RNA polymerase III subunit Rpc5 n=1 Tax=Kipferlia bialata TaxID=797122 RepID=A0A9K3GI55_9EUKA|nr:DNA-directed RNA polymerase III subunit Rpc5 [Kipferlia bialata]|eukprot:g4336.t1